MGELTVTPESGDDVKREQMRLSAIHLQRDFALWTESVLKNVVMRVYSRETGYEVLTLSAGTPAAPAFVAGATAAVPA